ncbi:MAG: putative glycolipid-binding domain-containing protein [Actinomycetes bacterium]
MAGRLAERRTVHTLAWAGPDPVRVDAAHAGLGSDTLTARGASTVADYVLDWTLETGPGWVTRLLSVRARGDGWSRSLVLRRDDDGTWSAVRRHDEDAPTALDVAGLGDALDCDLGLCPFTNTMPVLRHDMLAAAREGRDHSVDLVMAWVGVPGLTVQASHQRYTALGPASDGGALIRYASGDFEATIEFDPDGLVRDYPYLGRRVYG